MTDQPTLKEYDKLAPYYDQRWKSYIHASTIKTFQRLDLNQSSSVLDIGCGTGELLNLIRRTKPSIDLYGLDLSREMLKIAESKLENQVTLITGVASNISLPEQSIDTVVSVSSLHYWRDPKKSFLEVYRVLKPGGAFVVTDWCKDYYSIRALDLYLRLFNAAHFKVYGMKELETKLSDAGLVLVDFEKYKINFLWGMMTLVARKR